MVSETLTGESYSVATFVINEDSTTFTGYLNGEPIGSADFQGLSDDDSSTTIGFTDTPLPIGESKPITEANFVGVIDDVIVFNRALTKTEIAEMK